MNKEKIEEMYQNFILYYADELVSTKAYKDIEQEIHGEDAVSFDFFGGDVGVGDSRLLIDMKHYLKSEYDLEDGVANSLSNFETLEKTIVPGINKIVEEEGYSFEKEEFMDKDLDRPMIHYILK